ncbi:hypothetical protein OSB04_000762 [Centaurea solstitialis]|uniref:SOSEKI DIX-like domain-containing protein n=1 Tax=Centaurea solstitialis TaxID=347529 RepID=A0AA38U2C9_9ASTR|nr:hypothetical protein OSB04_000762 [Centaurea solstitialis]
MEEGGRRRVKVSPKSTAMMVKPSYRKVQVVYYVSKNDVLERLSVLRGRGMPSLYSWSCKRMYKNGYVWNDLGEDDVIFPSEGEEFVLKASQLVHQSPVTELFFLEAQLGARKSKQATPKRHTDFNQEELEFEEKRTNNVSELLPIKPATTTTTQSPPSPTTSGESNSTSKRFEDSTSKRFEDSTSKRFEDGDPYIPTLTRNSLLLHLMACGGSMGFKAKPVHHHHPPPPNTTATTARKSSCSSSSSLHKGVLCKAAATAAVEDEICCMSENPRFGNLQMEEREYFSGSIVETMGEDRVHAEPMLNKSNSYKEERRCMAAMAVAGEEEDRKREKKAAVAGKCIPKRFCSKPTKI